MIKNIKEGISHKIRKDKIKIQYELEFKKLINLTNDLVDQFISVKWERGKNEKGESRQVRVVDGKIEKFHATHSLSHSTSFNGQVSTFSNGLSSIGSINSGIDSLHGSNSNGNNGKYNTIGPSSSKSSDSTSSATPYIELEKIPKTLTRKQSKLLLGNKIDGSNCMSGGDAIAISFPNERITFKVHLFSDTIHQKQDHSLSTNYEQKLLNLYVYNNNNILCHTVIDLSLHTEETFNTIAIPFPSSSLIQPTLYMNIKSTLLKYNGIPIIKVSKEIIAKKEFGNFIQPNDGASKLIEYQGEIYYLSSKFNRNSNLTAGNSGGINSGIKEEPGKELVVVNKVLRFELDENNNKMVSNQSSSSSSEDENVNSNISNGSNNNNNNNNNYNEKNSSQSTGSTCDELIEEDHFKTNSIEIAHAKTLVQKNEEIKELNEKIKKLTGEVADQKRLRFSLQSLIDDCREKCLEYEEHFHRSQSLESYAKKQLLAERLEFQKKIERLSTQIKQLQQHQYQSTPLNNSINRILDDNGSNVIQDVILGKSDSNTPTIVTTSPDNNQESNHQNKLLFDKVDHLLKELDHKKQEIHQLTENTDGIQILLNQSTDEKKDLSIQLQEANKKVLELRTNIDKITKEQITVDLKRENEIRKRIKSGAHIDSNGNLIDSTINGNGINPTSFSNFIIQLFKLIKSNPKPFCILILIILLISYIL